MPTFGEEVKLVEAYMEKMRLPRPERPESFGETYEFPDDPSALSDTALGQLMLRLAAYYSYSIVLLGTVDSELALLEAFCKDAVAKFRLENELGRLNADMVEATAAAIDPNIADLRNRKIRRGAVQNRLKSYTESYQFQYNALSRELTRRSSSYKMIQ